MSVTTRWRARLAARRALLAAARKRHEWHPTSASRALLVKRKAQVAYAERVVARHSPKAHAASGPGVSQRGVDLIAQFEGCRLHPYRDAVGVWTIGYGHTAGVGPRSKPLPSVAAAKALLRDDLNRHYAPPVLALVRQGVPLNQNQIDALVSLVYNTGPGSIAPGTTIGNALRRHDLCAAADGFLLWDKAGGRRLEGLTRRRRAERALFLS